MLESECEREISTKRQAARVKRRKKGGGLGQRECERERESQRDSERA